MTAISRSVPLALQQVSKWYGNVIGINEATITIDGGAVALLGPNGAGKSTLMKLITGQLRPSLGNVNVFGVPPANPNSRRRVGYCPDVDAFYEEMTGRQFVHAMLKLSGYTIREAKERTDRSLDTVGMADRADKPIRGCSKGMRQRIKLAQAIAHDPDLLVLDEPLSGLDPVGRRDFCDLFRKWTQQGRTILISSHVMEEVEAVAESVILVGAGRVLTQGTWREINAFLNDIPQRYRVSSPAIRLLASRLIQWPGLVEVELLGPTDCVVTTRDGSGLCEEIGRLVCDDGFEVDRFKPEGHWAETLFGLAREAS
ncbi:ABC transporter ATP-binding protein [bacterium]|nr:ABC transporter ATP-binding protein [bacterium]